ncbi:MAG: Nif11 family protein, partial [Lentisphaeria bacterium]|nr:Nif11 family protein [Lentisphaeria bacterium]
YQKLETDPELRQRALELQKRFKDQEQVIDEFIALAAEQGHSFTATELVQYIFIHGKADS